MDVLASYQMRGRAPLDEIAVMLGYPGKLGMSGDKVWPAYQAGEIKKIRDYCETDALNTFLVYLRFELMRGNLYPETYEKELEKIKEYLKHEISTNNSQHFKDFLEALE